MFLALLTTFRLTLPHCQAIEAGACDTFKVVCAVTDSGLACDTLRQCNPETGLALLRVYWQTRWNGERRLWFERSIAGREGQRDSVEVLGDTVATIWVSTVDQAGNESCLSGPVWAGCCVGVEENARPPPEVRYYDVAGRVYHVKPTRSGVYWERRGSGRRRLVVLK